MTINRRRILCLALALGILFSLVPAEMGGQPAARAETQRMGITTDKVNVRYGASKKAKIAFELPADHVCVIKDTKTAEGVLWYRVETTNPARANASTYFGYIHGDYFRELTEEEIAVYLASDESAFMNGNSCVIDAGVCLSR